MLKSRHSYLAFVAASAIGLGGLAWIASGAEKPGSNAPGGPVRMPQRQLTLQPAAPVMPELATQPAPSAKIATVNMRLLFQTFKGSESLQRRAEVLNQEMMEARRGSNQEKMVAINREFQQLQQGAFEEMKAAVAFVAKRDGIGVVVPEEAFVYKDESLSIPDMTRAALDRWNVATTMPTSVPATEPAITIPSAPPKLDPTK